MKLIKNRKEETNMSAIAKKIVSLGAVILLSVTVLVGYARFFDMNIGKSRNESNLLRTEQYDKNQTNLEKTAHGMHVRFKEDGSIALYGKHEDPALNGQQRYESPFANMMLDQGIYTLSAGNSGADEDTFGLFVYVNGERFYVENGQVTFTVTEANSAAVIGWFVRNGDWLVYEKLYPTLAAGKNAIAFYEE